jgi:hypothetical protein
MRKETFITAAVGTLLALGLATYAVAAREGGTIASYTGCLKNGKLESVPVGDTPLVPCGAGQAQVRLSGGDVTSVGAGTGLTGGGDGGDIALAVDSSAVQSRVAGSCERNRLGPIDASISAIHQDGTVICNTDDVGSGPDVFAGFYDGPVAMPLLQGPGPSRSIRSRSRGSRFPPESMRLPRRSTSASRHSRASATS